MASAEDDVVVLELPSLGVHIDRWLSYSAHSHFTTPSDSFEATLAKDALPDNVINGLRAGARFRISVNGNQQADGYLDVVQIDSSRSGGTVVHIEGCDRLAQSVRAGIDPRTRFPDGSSLVDIVAKVFAPFGVTSIEASSDADRSLKSGKSAADEVASFEDEMDNQRVALLEAQRNNTKALSNDTTAFNQGVVKVKSAEARIAQLQRQIDAIKAKPKKASGSTTRGNKVSNKGKILKSFIAHQTKPYAQELCFAFASRLSQRFGLWIWISADGNSLIVDKPDFSQPPICRIVRGEGASSPVISGTAREDSTHQPSVIVATGFSFGGEADRSSLKVIAINEIVSLDNDFTVRPAVQKIIADNSDAKVIQTTVFAIPTLRPHAAPQPAYLHDQESQTIEQLENFARRELALRQKDSLKLDYVVEGHAYQGQTWTVDTIVDVDDDILGIHEPMWVLSRTFQRDRSNGSTTRLELIRPETLLF